MTLDPVALSRAIVLWLGYGISAWPKRDASRLTAEFDQTTAALVLSRVRELEAEFYRSDARLTMPSLKEMGDEAARDFRRNHPELLEDAIQALAWSYTFDYK